MKIPPTKIYSWLWIEKAAILPVVLAASKKFFEANVLHQQPGIPVNARAEKVNTTLHSQYSSFFHDISFE